MKRLLIGFALTLAACSPAIDARDGAELAPEPILEAPVMAAPVMTECQIGGDDGIGGTGCR